MPAPGVVLRNSESAIDNRKAISVIHFLQKDSKNVIKIDLVHKLSSLMKVNPPNNASFPHNFQSVQSPYTG